MDHASFFSEATLTEIGVYITVNQCRVQIKLVLLLWL